MKKIGTFLLAITCLITAAPLESHAQQPPQVDESVTRTAGDKPGAVITREGMIQALVAGINYDTREITLQGANGRTVTLKAGESVARFNEIKQGDRVTVKVTESVAITVASPGAMSSAAVDQSGQKTPGGATMTAAGRTSARVQKIDYKTREVTLQFENGRSQSFVAGPEVTRFDAIKQGDVILVSYVGAVAAEITRN